MSIDPNQAVRPLKPLPALIFASRWLTVIHVVFLVSAVSIAFIDRLLQVPSRNAKPH